MAADREITTEDRREFTRLRSLLVSASSIQVLHSDQERRLWMTDQYVLLDVTGSPAVDPDIEDGIYRLVTTQGLVRKPGIATVNLPLYFAAVKWAAWLPAWPTGWSITDSEAKAMLFYVDAVSAEGRCRIPLAMNEDVWHAFRSAYPYAGLWHAGYGGPFRVSIPGHDELAYVQPVQIPLEMRGSAQALMKEIDGERKGTQGSGEQASGSERDRRSDGDSHSGDLREGSTG